MFPRQRLHILLAHDALMWQIRPGMSPPTGLERQRQQVQHVRSGSPFPPSANGDCRAEGLTESSQTAPTASRIAAAAAPAAKRPRRRRLIRRRAMASTASSTPLGTNRGVPASARRSRASASTGCSSLSEWRIHRKASVRLSARRARKVHQKSRKIAIEASDCHSMPKYFRVRPSARSDSSALCRRDFTVPRGMSSAEAISSSDISSTNRIRSASRCATGSIESA